MMSVVYSTTSRGCANASGALHGLATAMQISVVYSMTSHRCAGVNGTGVLMPVVHCMD